MRFQSNLNVIWQIESNIRALVLLNLLNSLRKRDKMLSKPRIFSLSLNSFNKFNKTWALMLDPLYTRRAARVAGSSWFERGQTGLSDGQTDKYFYLGSGQDIDIKANYNITLHK